MWREIHVGMNVNIAGPFLVVFYEMRIGRKARQAGVAVVLF